MTYFEDEVTRLVQQVDILTRAVHLLTTSAKPTSEWLDASMAKTADATGNYPGKVHAL